jgi:hypothetical protein
MAYTRIKGPEMDKIVIFDQKGQPGALFRFRRNFDIALQSAEQKNGFRISIKPVHFPLFPYNFLTGRPAYLADQSGSIRMTYVRKPESCDPDAPVVMKVDESQVREIINTLKK